MILKVRYCLETHLRPLATHPPNEIVRKKVNRVISIL